MTDIDKCDQEYNETYFHTDSYIDGENELEYLRLALKCGKKISIRLSNQFKNERFRIMISFSETIMVDGLIDNYSSSTVRFYNIRPSCNNKIC